MSKKAPGQEGNPGQRNSSAPGLASFLRQLGAMRIALGLLAVAMLVSAPKPKTEAVFSGWEMWPTLIVPTLTPIIFMVLMLDALMSRVKMTSVQGDEYRRYRRFVVYNMALGLMLVIYWTPYYLALGR
jgi:uncharacterized membrane protein